jgi:HSP20 family protein
MPAGAMRRYPLEVFMLYRSLFPRTPFFVDFDQLQRELQRTCESTPAVRGLSPGPYPAVNVGTSPEAVEVLVFAPGMEAKSFDVHVERGVLSVSGERAAQAPGTEGKTSVHLNERFAGRFRRVVRLPDDVDASQVSAEYRDGVLRVRLARHRAPEGRRISVQ